MSITSKSKSDNSEEYLNKLLSLSNDEFVKLTNKKQSIDNLNNTAKDNSLEDTNIINDSSDK